MKDKKAKGNLLLKSIGFLLLPLIAFVLFSFLTYPIKPHCSLGNGISGCTPSCEPTSYFEDGRPAGYKETPCFHDEPTMSQLFIFNKPWSIPLILVVLMISIFISVCKKGLKPFFKKTFYIAFAPIFLLKENKKNKNLISRIFVILIAFFLIIEWLIGYYVVVTTFTATLEEARKREQISYIERTKPKEPNISSDEVFKLTNDERIKNERKSFKRSPKLDEAALERAKVIIEYDEWAHEATKSGIPYQEALRKANYWNINYGENLANGQFTSAEVVNGLMNSEGHRENILNPDFQEIGIATYPGYLNGVNTVVTVQIFGGYEPPNYSQENINGWLTALNSLKGIKLGWENIRNNPSFYEANRQDAERIIEIINIRVYRIEKIVGRMQSNRWLTAEENRWTYDDEKLSNEQEVIATRLNSR